MNLLLALLSISIQSSKELIVGRNTITITNTAVIYQNLDPQTFLIFDKPLPKNIQVTVQKHNQIAFKVTNMDIGIHIGIDSGTVVFEPTNSIDSTTNISFYYLESTEEYRNANKYYLSTVPNDVFVLGNKGDNGFSTVKDLNQGDKIVYWLLSGHAEEITTSSLNIHEGSQQTFYSFDDLQRNLIEVNADEDITITSNEFFFFSYHAKKVENDQVLKISSKLVHHRSKSIPSTRYKFYKNSKTQLLKSGHSFDPYTNFMLMHKQLPFEKLKVKDSIYEFIFDKPIIYLMLGLICVIITLIAVLLYVAKDSSQIIYLVSRKRKTDEESLLKQSEKSPELASLKNDGVI